MQSVAKIVALVTLALAAPAAQAQAFPVKPIRIIVPVPPGSTIDILGRIVAASLTKSLGQQVIVDNRPGASGMIGMAAAAKSPADGYTFAVVALGQHVQTPIVLHASAPFDPIKDFAALSVVATGPVVLSIHPSIPAPTLAALVALAKRRPGQLNYGSNGVGSANHIVAEMLKQLGGIDLVHVPYKGNVEVINGLVTGEVSIVFTGVPPVVSYVQSGRLRLLATTGRERLKIFPQVPTMREAGYPAAETEFWYGAVAPAGTPREAVVLLNREIVAALAQPEVREQIARQGVDPESSTPEQFARMIRDDHERWSGIIRKAGIRAQ